MKDLTLAVVTLAFRLGRNSSLEDLGVLTRRASQKPMKPDGALRQLFRLRDFKLERGESAKNEERVNQYDIQKRHHRKRGDDEAPRARKRLFGLDFIQKEPSCRD